MMPIRYLLGILGLCLLAAPVAAATITPSVGIVVDGVLVGTVEAKPDAESGGWIIDQFHWGNEGLGAEITLSAFLDPDPSILYAGSVIDFGAPSTFGFIFIQP